MPILFGALVLASAAGLAESQRLKTQPAILDRVEVGGVFTPNGDCREDRAPVGFRLTEPDRVTITITRPGGRHIRTLLEDRRLPAYRNLLFAWDGLNDAGEPAETGPYEVMVELAERDRTLEIGGRLRLHRSRYDPRPGCERERRDPPVRSDADREEDRARQ